MPKVCQHCGAVLALGAIACFRCGRMLDAEARGGTTGGGALPTELQTLAKAGLLEGQWRLLEPIGQGKSGVVWEAHDVTLDRRVAVKVLHEALTSVPQQVIRFEREAKVLAALDHPNLTPVLGSGRFEGRPFVVMRLLAGRTVAELLHARGGKLSLPEVSFCLLPVCDALQALHDSKVVHRDLKPSNVFIGDDGRVTLLDLGQAFEAGSELTRTGELIGAAEYLSPEQVAGHGVDGRSDVYALGCLMHELLTGAPPFTGELQEVLRAHATAARPGAHSLPAGAGAVVVKMLSVAPAERPALSDVRGLLQSYAPPSIPLPKLHLPDRERQRTTHGVDREPDTTPQEPLAPLRSPQEEPTAPQGRPLREEPTQAQAKNPLSVLAAPRASPLDADATRVLHSPLESEATVVGAQLKSVREQITRPTQQPLSPRMRLAIVVTSVLVFLAVVVGVAQPPPPLPEPVRVDQPKVEMQVKVEPPPQSLASQGPPPDLLPDLPAPALPALTEKKEKVNAAPLVAAPPKRGRPPNRGPVQKGYPRIVTSLDGDEITCRLSIDGKLVGKTPYWSGILRPGEHVMKAECFSWPAEVMIWPIPPVALQKQGELIEIPIGSGTSTGADQPIQGNVDRTTYFIPCPHGAPQCSGKK